MSWNVRVESVAINHEERFLVRAETNSEGIEDVPGWGADCGDDHVVLTILESV
jgi:hypothetical protein